MPEVRDVVPGISFTAVASANGKTGTVMVTALPIEQARANLTDRGIDRGKDLAPGRVGKILVGRGVARKLGLAPGASLSLFALSKGGGVNTQSYTISGTTATIIAALDNVSVFMDLGDAQSLIGSDAVPQLIVFLKNTSDSARVAQTLRGASPGSTLVRSHRPHVGGAFTVLSTGKLGVPARAGGGPSHRPDRRPVLDLGHALPCRHGAASRDGHPESLRDPPAPHALHAALRGPDPRYWRGSHRLPGGQRGLRPHQRAGGNHHAAAAGDLVRHSDPVHARKSPSSSQMPVGSSSPPWPGPFSRGCLHPADQSRTCSAHNRRFP